MNKQDDLTKIVVPVYKESKTDKQIPSAVFIEKVEDFSKTYGVDNVIESLTNALNKFQFTEGQFLKFKNSMSVKVPEIEKAVELIEFLQNSKEESTECNFMLNDGIYCTATAKKDNKGI